MGTRVEQSSEFLPRASRTSRRHLEDMADSLYRLPSAAEDLQVIIPRCNRALLLQGEFCITLFFAHAFHDADPSRCNSRRSRNTAGTCRAARLTVTAWSCIDVLCQ